MDQKCKDDFCGGNGKCTKTQEEKEYCKCHQINEFQYIGKNCSYQTLMIMPFAFHKLRVNPLTYEYVYFNYSEVLSTRTNGERNFQSYFFTILEYGEVSSYQLSGRYYNDQIEFRPPHEKNNNFQYSNADNQSIEIPASKMINGIIHPILVMGIKNLDPNNVHEYTIFYSLSGGNNNHNSNAKTYSKSELISFLVLYISIIVIIVVGLISIRKCLKKNKKYDPKETEMEEYDKVQVYDTCQMCDKLFKPEQIYTKSKCDHIFHTICFKKWMASGKQCPICYEDLLEDEDEKEEVNLKID